MNGAGGAIHWDLHGSPMVLPSRRRVGWPRHHVAEAQALQRASPARQAHHVPGTGGLQRGGAARRSTELGGGAGGSWVNPYGLLMGN